MDTRSEIEIRYFNKLARDKKSQWWGSETPAGRERSYLRARKAIEYINNTAENVLEIGCSRGYFTHDLLSLSSGIGKITAIDVSSELISIAKGNSKSDKAEFLVENAQKMSFSDNCFGAVVGNAVLHHLELALVLPEIRRVLATGGKFFFAEPNMLNPQVFIEKKIKFIGRLLQNSPLETAFFRWKIKKIFESEGFKNVEVVPFDFMHPLVPAGLIRFIRPISNILENTFLLKEISGSLIIKGEKRG